MTTDMQRRIEQAVKINAATCAFEGGDENAYNVITALKGTIAGLLAAINTVAGEDAEMPDPDRRAEFRGWIAAWDAGVSRAIMHVQAKEAASNG